MSTTPPQTELLTVIESAQVLGISRRSFYVLQNTGKVGPTPIKITPGMVRYRRQELLDWIAAGCPDHNTWIKQRELATA